MPESLIADPAGVLKKLYEHLEFGDFDAVRQSILAETERRKGYKAKGNLPLSAWQARISREWAGMLEQHATLR